MKAIGTLMAACVIAFSISGCSQTEKAEATAAEIEAAQLEGRNAAKTFITREWRDTMELQKHILEAKALQSKYEIAGKHACALAFDSAFIITVRSVRPELAAELERRIK